jgi:O-antigen/teichoic acid export membrane protein
MVVMARLLSPSDFGLVAIASSLVNFLSIAVETGFLFSFTQREHLTHELASTFLWFMFALGVLAAGIGAAAAVPIGLLFGRPEISAVVVALSCCLPISAFGMTHAALLRRQMRQGALVGGSAMGAIVATVVGVLAAAAGWGWWSLVLHSAAGTLTRCIAFWCLCDWRPGLPVRGVGIRQIVGNGSFWTTSELVELARRSIDQPLVGWWWGADVLGVYSRGVALASIFYTSGIVPISAAIAPALIRLQSQPERLRLACLQIAGAIGFLAAPLFAFALVAADQLVAVMLGEGWDGSVPVLRLTLFGLYFFSSVGVMANLYAAATGKSRALAKAAVVALPLAAMSCLVAIRFGPVAVAAALGALAMCTNLYALQVVVAHERGLSGAILRRFAPPAWRAVAAAAFSAVAVRLLDTNSSPFLLLGVSATVFAGAYLGLWCVSVRGREFLVDMAGLALGDRLARAVGILSGRVR